MNTGLQEIHSLAHKLNQIQKYPEHSEKILSTYDKERKQFVTEILNTANKYYKVSLDIAKNLGLNIENLFSFKKALDVTSKFVPKSIQQFVWKTGIKVGSYQVEVQSFEKVKQKLKEPGNTVPLIFYKEDTEFKYDNGYISTKGKNIEDRNLCGMLLPHILMNFKGQQLALRQLPDCFLENQTDLNIVYSDKTKNNTSNNLGMVALYQTGFDKNKIQNFIENLEELYVKPDYIVGIEMNKENVDEQKLKQLFSNDKQMVLIRSDAHIFGRYEL